MKHPRKSKSRRHNKNTHKWRRHLANLAYTYGWDTFSLGRQVMHIHKCIGTFEGPRMYYQQAAAIRAALTEGLKF